MKHLYWLFLLSFYFGACQQQKDDATSMADEPPDSPPKDTLHVEVDRTAVDYSLLVRDSNYYRVLSFYKHKDSTTYNHLKYSCHCGDSILLADEIGIIESLWQRAKDSIDIGLHSVNVGYPLMFKDVRTKHIEAFINDDNWQRHVADNGRELAYDLIRQIMIDQKVYKSLEELLESNGYQVEGLSTEKHGFVVEEDLQQFGYTGSEIIPMPYMVNITLKPTSP